MGLEKLPINFENVDADIRDSATVCIIYLLPQGSQFNLLFTFLLLNELVLIGFKSHFHVICSWSGPNSTVLIGMHAKKGKECALGFSRCSWGKKIAWRAQRGSAKEAIVLVAFPYALQFMIHNSAIGSHRCKISFAMGEEGQAVIYNLCVIWLCWPKTGQYIWTKSTESQLWLPLMWLWSFSER